MRALSLFIAGSALALTSAGCATTTRITVHSSDRTNDGASMYMMVRSWDGKPSFGERYQEIAAKAFVEPADHTVLATKPILPGEEKTTVTINADTAKEIIIYFFFTDPGPGWQVPVRRPLPAEIDIDLGRHDVENVRTRPR
jgi:azurin